MSDLQSFHDLTGLFGQLGLPNDTKSIEAFIAAHRPLPDNIQLWEAPFWTPSQSSFLREAFDIDAEWASAFDMLNSQLR